ncbi:hypothetical protein HGRIS_005407 [Hohenbuehelia grisea]|uniref:Uncharacterized protein n=1 Tax=Hohenbuehelia grisea TaxID=104357 RepID=A0ABR3JF68_9AGAR
MADRVKGKMDWFVETYKHHNKRLRVTGGGIGDDHDQDKENNREVHMDFYIPASGPSADTPPIAKNLWQSITEEFPFFPRLHVIFSSRPNVNPPAVMTVLGRNGPQTRFFQPITPEVQQQPQPMSTTPVNDSDLNTFLDNPEVQHQYRTLQEALFAASQHVPPATPQSGNNLDAEPFETPFHQERTPSPPPTPTPTPAPASRASMPPSTPAELTAVAQAKLSAHVRPRKPTFEEGLLEISKTHLEANQAIEMKKLRIQAMQAFDTRRTQVMAQYREGLLTIEEAKEKIKLVDEEEKELVA